MDPFISFWDWTCHGFLGLCVYYVAPTQCHLLQLQPRIPSALQAIACVIMVLTYSICWHFRMVFLLFVSHCCSFCLYPGSSLAICMLFLLNFCSSYSPKFHLFFPNHIVWLIIPMTLVWLLFISNYSPEFHLSFYNCKVWWVCPVTTARLRFIWDVTEYCSPMWYVLLHHCVNLHQAYLINFTSIS